VTKAELIDSVWPDVSAADNSLAQCVLEIRRALDDDAQQLVRTVARRGYLFVAPVTTPPTEVSTQFRRGCAHIGAGALEAAQLENPGSCHPFASLCGDWDPVPHRAAAGASQPIQNPAKIMAQGPIGCAFVLVATGSSPDILVLQRAAQALLQSRRAWCLVPRRPKPDQQQAHRRQPADTDGIKPDIRVGA
jgi:hypothetical protein